MNTPSVPPESTVPAPGQSAPPSYIPVLISGVITTALALCGLRWTETNIPDLQIMGRLIYGVLPWGAIAVGLVAGSGYGISSWATGIKIVRGLFWAVLFFGICGYAVAQYLEYKNFIAQHPQVTWSFFEYYDIAARSLVYRSSDSATDQGTPLGVWGYGINALELIGFAGGGLIVPLLLSRKPYCENCKRYMKFKALGLLAGSALTKKIKKSDAAGQAEYQAQQQAATAGAQGALQMMREMAAQGRVDDFRNTLEPMKIRPKDAFKMPIRYRVALSSCGKCSCGSLRIWQMTGRGKQMKQTELPRSEASPEFVTGILAKK